MELIWVVVTVVVRMVMEDSPVAFAAALLLGRGWVDALVAGLAEVAGEMLLRGGGAIGEADVVTIGNLVCASHCEVEMLALES